ncbi:hypothetical protein U1Q18_031344 [Sarracenia purpurea var. burkii]
MSDQGLDLVKVEEGVVKGGRGELLDRVGEVGFRVPQVSFGVAAVCGGDRNHVHAILSYGGNNKVGSGEGRESNIGETIGKTVVDCPEGDKAILDFPPLPRRLNISGENGTVSERASLIPNQRVGVAGLVPLGSGGVIAVGGGGRGIM